MNYLAHIYLSGNNEKLMIGNFMADAVKGKNWKAYSHEVQKGIQLHRAIDHFTDTHPIVKESKKRLWERYRHYNAVIIDIFYDHFLAKHWLDYHDTPLDTFVRQTYDLLLKNRELLPEKIQILVKYMIKNNWLYNYQFTEGIHNVMQGMSRRTSFDSGMETATEDLLQYFDEFEREFKSFFPLLMRFTQTKIASL